MKTLKILYNPFERYAESGLLLLGSIALLLGSGLGYVFNSHFDGALDLHFAHEVTWWMPLVENLIALASVFLLFLIFGKFINKKTRAVDVLAFSLIARIPIYLATFTNINNISLKTTEEILPLLEDPTGGLPILPLLITLVLAAVGILCLVWMIALLYNGFKVATHGRRRNLIAGLVLSIIIAEALSKFVLAYFF